MTSAWRTQSRGDRFGIITTHNHLVELSTFEIHSDTAWSVVMNHGEDLGVAGAEGAYGHRPRNARTDTKPVDGSHGVVEHLDCPDGPERHPDLAVNSFDPLHCSETHHQFVSIDDELGQVVLLHQSVALLTDHLPYSARPEEVWSNVWPPGMSWEEGFSCRRGCPGLASSWARSTPVRTLESQSSPAVASVNTAIPCARAAPVTALRTPMPSTFSSALANQRWNRSSS